GQKSGGGARVAELSTPFHGLDLARGGGTPFAEGETLAQHLGQRQDAGAVLVGGEADGRRIGRRSRLGEGRNRGEGQGDDGRAKGRKLSDHGWSPLLVVHARGGEAGQWMQGRALFFSEATRPPRPPSP